MTRCKRDRCFFAGHYEEVTIQIRLLLYYKV